jgi:polyisoprenoid-binding protein YceI
VHYFRLHILLPLICLLLSGGSSFAQDVSIQKDQSTLWIEGKSNVNQFTCHAKKYSTLIDTPEMEHDPFKLFVEIAVNGFDCGKRRMNRDLYDALKADDHPTIDFEYEKTHSLSYSDSTDLYKLMVNGTLTVAGHTKTIEFPMSATLLDEGSIRAEGQANIRMSEYNVEPPTALFGLVKVDDKLTVHFELFASIKDPGLLRDEKHN